MKVSTHIIPMYSRAVKKNTITLLTTAHDKTVCMCGGGSARITDNTSYPFEVSVKITYFLTLNFTRILARSFGDDWAVKISLLTNKPILLLMLTFSRC